MPKRDTAGNRVIRHYASLGARFECSAACTCGYQATGIGDDILRACGLSWNHRSDASPDGWNNWTTIPGHEQWYERNAILPDGTRIEIELGAPRRIPTKREREDALRAGHARLLPPRPAGSWFIKSLLHWQ